VAAAQARQANLTATGAQIAATVARATTAAPTAGVKLGSLTPVRGNSVVVARLRNGRTAELQFTPALATVGAVNQLRGQIMTNDRRQAAATAANAKALRRLGNAQANAIRRLTAQQLKTDRALTQRIAAGDAQLDRRIRAALGKGGSMGKKQTRFIRRMIRNNQKRALWNNILLATSLPFWFA
jgi:hypothetical protein